MAAVATAVVAARVGGTHDAQAWAALARGRLRAKLLEEGRGQAHHRVLLQRILAHLAFVETSMAQVPQKREQQLAPGEEAVTLVQSAVGIGPVAAAAIVAEMGSVPFRHASRLVGGRESRHEAERREAPEQSHHVW